MTAALIIPALIPALPGMMLTRLGEPADHRMIAARHEGRGVQRIARR